MKNISLFLILIFLFAGCAEKSSQKLLPEIIPVPLQMEMKKGSFRISSSTKIFVNTTDEDVKGIAERLRHKLSLFAGKDLMLSPLSGKPGRNAILLNLDPALNGELEKEGYKLWVRGSGVEIKAASPAGLFYGVQTLYQMLPPEIFGDPEKLAGISPELQVPCVEITDKPSFSWRGMHLDVSRHFFPKEFIKKYIDLIAFHKMNVFHWHLTDDNGWRIQIDRYPLLTEVAAWRADRKGIPWSEAKPQQAGEEATYGGFYTKDDIREIVAYAQQRFVTIIPEIEMPGHTSEVFAAYPEFSCSGKKITVQTASYWPNNDIFCAGKDETFRFIENVLDEVMELFPAEYIHIGGDEADKTAWKTCRDCQSRIRKEGLSGEDELQSYFVKRIGKYLNDNGRRMIGWDEILEGGLAPDATVMSWRGYEGGIEAAKQGHQVVMCPGSHCYFDHYQSNPDFQPPAIGGLTTLQKVYSFRPVPSELLPEERKMILGGQGNVWTEYISTPSHAEYMALPRMTALAEVLWSDVNKLEWIDFKERLQKQFKRFDQMDVNYFKGSGKVEVSALFNVEEKPYSVALATEAAGTSIHYTLDGYIPDRNSFVYKKPISIGHNVTLKAVAYKDGKKMEIPAEYKISHHQALGKAVLYRIGFSERYPGKGINTLNDGLRGSLNYNDGYWQGFNGTNADIIIDLGEDVSFTTLTATFLQDHKKWIFLPETVNYYFSMDGDKYQKIAGVKHAVSLDNPSIQTNDFMAKLNKPLKARYLQIEGVNIGVCPEWHPGKGQKAWVFIDEITVR
jgi:hexosaminidase